MGDMTMARSGLDELPPEIGTMIVGQLEPEDVKSMHFTSRYWSNISEPRYSKFFFGTVVVFFGRASLDRLDAISRNEICRRRVREIRITFMLLRPTEATDQSPEDAEVSAFTQSMDDSKARDYEQLCRLGAPMAARINDAARRMKHCTLLSITDDFDGYWPDEEEPRFPSTFDFYLSPGRGFRENENHTDDFANFLFQTALNVMTACQQIRAFKYKESSCCWALPINLPSIPSLHNFKQFEHIESLTLVGGLDEPVDEVPPFASLFPKVKRLKLGSRIVRKVKELGRVLEPFMKGLESLTLQAIKCKMDQFAALIEDRRMKGLKRLRLNSISLKGGTQAWEEAIMRIWECLELDELTLEDCLSDRNLESGRGVPDWDYRHLRPPCVLTYRHLRESTPHAMISKFRKHPMSARL